MPVQAVAVHIGADAVAVGVANTGAGRGALRSCSWRQLCRSPVRCRHHCRYRRVGWLFRVVIVTIYVGTDAVAIGIANTGRQWGFRRSCSWRQSRH